jgi:hypothetical protein
MKKQVKNFNQFVNEAKFHHSLPNNTGTRGPRLRDDFRALSQEERADIEELAAELDRAGLLNYVKRKLSSISDIDELKRVMADVLSSDETHEEPNWSIGGHSSTGDEGSDNEGWEGGGYFYGKE